MHEGPGSFKGQRAAYRTNLPHMLKTRATYTAHMPGKGQFLVQGHPKFRTVVENRTPGKRSSKMERSILDNCTRPPAQMNCVFPEFNLRRFEDNQAAITSETRSICSTREIAIRQVHATLSKHQRTSSIAVVSVRVYRKQISSSIECLQSLL